LIAAGLTFAGLRHRERRRRQLQFDGTISDLRYGSDGRLAMLLELEPGVKLSE
jgi:hypothetical protein